MFLIVVVIIPTVVNIGFKIYEAKSFKTQTKTQIERAKESTKVCL